MRFAFFPSGAAVCAQHIRRLPKGCQACQIQVQVPNSFYLEARLEIEARFAFPPSYNPSPQACTYRSIDPKIGDDRSCWLFFSIFCPSNLHSKICIEKITKKMRKSRILASQNPSKTHPKCLQNRGPKKHATFDGFLAKIAYIVKGPMSFPTQ